MARPASAAAAFIPFPTRFPKDILDAIKAMAAQGRRPINEQILILIEQALAQSDTPLPRAHNRRTPTPAP